MAIIKSAVEICNLALSYLNKDSITDFVLDPKTKDERACALHYEQCRQSLLEMHNWTFAKTRVQLAQDTDTPVFGWEKQSATFPSDYRKFLALYSSDGILYVNTNNAFYEIEDNKILTNLSAPYNMLYIRDETTVSRFSHLFITGLSYLLALNMGKFLGSSVSLLDRINDKYMNEWRPLAIAMDSQQNPPRIISSSPYVNIRTQGITESQFYV